MTTELIDWKEEMKININGYIKNINTNEKQAINSISIYNKNKISYFDNNNKYTIKLPSKDKLILIRENNDILSTMCFKKNKTIECNYIIKTNDITLSLEINDKYIKVLYLVNDSNTKYEYYIEKEWNNIWALKAIWEIC